MRRAHSVAVLAALSFSVPALSQPLGTAFTFQGELTDAGSPAVGPHDLRFRLYDAAAGGSQVGAVLCADNVGVTGGKFTVALDFGAQFSGQQRFLEVEVRVDSGLDCSDLTGFTPLLPRQALTGAPNAVFALTAGAATTATTAGTATTATTAATATNATQLNGQAAAFYQNAANLSSGTLTDARLSGNIPRLNTGNVFFGGPNTFGSVVASDFSGAGSNLTNLNAGHLSVGTLPGGRLAGVYANEVHLDNLNNSFGGNGALLHTLNAGELQSGTVPEDRLGGIYSNPLTLSNAANVIAGSGAGLTSLSASNLASGTLADARLSANVALVNNTQTFTGVKSFSVAPFFNAGGSPFLVTSTTRVANLNADLLDGLSSAAFAQVAGANTFSNPANAFTGSGAGLTGLNASNIATGTLLDARLPTGGAWSLSSNLSVDAGTLAIDQLNNRVGIGAASPTAKLEIGGVAGIDGIKFPDGSLQVTAAITLRRNIGTFDLSPIGAGASTTVGGSVSGAALGSVVVVSPTSDLGAGIVVGPAWVSSPGNVTFRVQNLSNVGVDPAATQFTIAVIP